MTTEDVIAIRVPTPFAVGDVIVYLVKGDALTLIDAGLNTKEAARALQERLCRCKCENVRYRAGCTDSPSC